MGISIGCCDKSTTLSETSNSVEYQTNYDQTRLKNKRRVIRKIRAISLLDDYEKDSFVISNDNDNAEMTGMLDFDNEVVNSNIGSCYK